MSSKHKTLRDLFHHQLKDLYYAERHGGKMLLKMAKAAKAEALRHAFEKRHDEVSAHVGRLDAIFEAIDKKPHGVPCEAMQGIIEETKALIDDFDEGAVRDAGLIAGAQAMEHYAVARYGALQLWAGQVDLASALAPIEATVSEARQAVERWASLAGTLPLRDAPDTSEPLTLKHAALMGIG